MSWITKATDDWGSKCLYWSWRWQSNSRMQEPLCWNQLAEQKLESVPYTAIASGFWFSDSMKSLMGPQDDIHGDHESQPTCTNEIDSKAWASFLMSWITKATDDWGSKCLHWSWRWQSNSQMQAPLCWNQLEQKLESMPYTAIASGFWFSDSTKSLMGPKIISMVITNHSPGTKFFLELHRRRRSHHTRTLTPMNTRRQTLSYDHLRSTEHDRSGDSRSHQYWCLVVEGNVAYHLKHNTGKSRNKSRCEHQDLNRGG
jgi:hypothetical protein